MKTKSLPLITLLFFFTTFCTIAYGQALSGNFTVGTSTSDYATLTIAAQALQDNGVGTGGAMFTIEPGTYNEKVVFENIAGLSETNPLIITADEGTVTFEATGTSNEDSIITVNSLSWVTFNGLDLVDITTVTGEEIEHGYLFESSATVGCSNNNITNGSIFLGANGARPITSTRALVFRSNADTEAGANNNNRIENMTIDNSSWGIQLRASASLFGQIIQENFNNQVINCTFGANASLGHDLSSGALAINAQGERNLLISGNIVESIENLNASPALPVSTSGISLDTCSGEISNNIINNIEYESTSGSVFGIRTSTFTDDVTIIKNNKISGLRRSNITASTTDPSLSLQGIWIFNQGGNNGLARVFHNSIFITADQPLSYSSAGIQLSGGSTGEFPGEVFNNIIVNNISTSSPSYRSFALVDGNTERGFLISDYNLLFANGTNGYLGGIGRELGGNEQFTNDLQEFINISETNENSVNFLPELTDLENGDLSVPQDISNPENYRVPTLDEVPLDILGDTRFTARNFFRSL